MDERNGLHIFSLNEGKEEHVVVYSDIDWTTFDASIVDDLYAKAHKEVCDMFKVSSVEELPEGVSWCYDTVRIPDMNRVDTNSEEWKRYLELYVTSECACCTDSMNSMAYKELLHACRHNGDEDMDDGVTNDEYKDLRFLTYLFEEICGYQRSRVDVGAWVLPDGSYIVIDSANHRRLVEDYMGYKEYDIERTWLKLSLYKAYTHPNMTDKQWATLNTFLENYQIGSADSDWYEGKYYV